VTLRHTTAGRRGWRGRSRSPPGPLSARSRGRVRRGAVGEQRSWGISRRARAGRLAPDRLIGGACVVDNDSVGERVRLQSGVYLTAFTASGRRLSSAQGCDDDNRPPDGPQDRGAGSRRDPRSACRIGGAPCSFPGNRGLARTDSSRKEQVVTRDFCTRSSVGMGVPHGRERGARAGNCSIAGAKGAARGRRRRPRRPVELSTAIIAYRQVPCRRLLGG